MHSSPHSNNPWLRISKTNPHARLRLFCFPHAGGAASHYRAWHQYLPAGIEVCPVQLPGRENRIRERPFNNVGELIQELMPNLLPYLDKPFAFFGHSMGALIIYELAQQLRQQTGQMPAYLLVSGRRAPFLPESEALLHTLPSDEALLTELQRRYQNIPDIMFQESELRDISMPYLWADFTLAETYQYMERRPLPCPIVAFGGQDDHSASQAELIAWQNMTQSSFDLHVLPGGHFYLEQQVQPLLTLITGYL